MTRKAWRWRFASAATRDDESGVAAIEFAIVAPVFILLAIGVCEIGLMTAGQHVLEDATFVGSRTSKTGYVAANTTQAATVAASIKRAAGAYLNPAKIVVKTAVYADFGDVGQPEPFTDANKNGVRDGTEAFTDVNGNGSYDKDRAKSGNGAGGEIVVFTATYDWKLNTPLFASLLGKNGVYQLQSRAVVKNEPF